MLGKKRLRRAPVRRRKLALETLEVRRVLAAFVWNTDDNGVWDDAANWSPQQVPGPQDDVVIDRPNANPIVTIRDARTVGSLLSREMLVVTQGRLQLNGTSRIEGSSLTVDASELAAFGNLTIAADAGMYWFSGTVQGNGVVNQGLLMIEGIGPSNLLGTIDNRAGGVVDVAGDVHLTGADGFGNATGKLLNAGTIRKSLGNGTATIDPTIDMNGGTLEAQSGRLQLARSGFWRSGVLNASAGAVVGLSAGAAVTGDFGGSGAGRIEMSGGTLASFDGGVSGERATLNFPAGLFHWTGGDIGSGGCGSTVGCASTIVNADQITVSGSAGKTLRDSGLKNSGTLVFAGSGDVNFLSTLEVTSTGVVELATDARLTGSDQFNNETGRIVSAGTIRKTSGSGTATIFPSIDMKSGTIESQSGRLKLTRSGFWQGGQLNASSGAVVEMAAGALLTGDFTGSGAGKIEFSDGRLGSYTGGVSGAHATLNFPAGLFAWSGGEIGSGGCASVIGCAATLVNAGFMQIEGSGSKGIRDSGLINEGTVINNGSGLFGLNATTFQNVAGAVYDHRGDGAFSGLDQFGNAGRFVNAGTLRKSAGNGTVEITARMEIQPTGVVDVDTGRFRFARGGYWTGGTFQLEAGAGVDLVGDGNNPFILDTGTYTGSGLGTLVHTGQMQAANGATPVLDFPEGLFHWRGGTIFNRLVNDGHITLDSPTDVFSGIEFTNRGVFVHSGAGSYVLGPSSTFDNQGLYDLRTDADIVVPNSQSSGTTRFINSGTFRKSSGIGISEFRLDSTQFGRDLRFENPGTVEALSGTLLVHRSVPQVSGSTLTGGTWRVGPSSKLQLTAHGNLTINQAHVILDGTNATFVNLTRLADNRGTFELQGSRDFTTFGALVNSGRIVVGPGSELTVNGNYTQATSNPSGPSLGTLEFEIASRPRPDRFGRMIVQNAASLAGVLEASLVDGFGPTPGDSYDVLKYATRSGSFSQFVGVSPNFDALVEATKTTLAVRADVPVHDLDVTNIVVPSTARPGESITIDYTVRNLSTAATAASWFDSIYLSSDSTYDSTDLLIGRVFHTGGVGGTSDYQESLTAPLPAIVDGLYRVLVLADSRGLVPDTDRSNNGSASASLVSVASTPLTIGTLLSSTSTDGADRYFRLDVPAGGELSILGTFSTANQAEFYVRRGDMPTRTTYDFVANDPNELARRIKISDPQAGPFYILVHGREGSSSPTPFSLFATYRSFALDSSSPARGSNLGATTLTLDGLGFTQQSVVELVKGSTTLAAKAVEVESARRMYALFDLTGLAVGSYAVRVRQGAQSTTSSQFFQVVVGQPGQLEVRVVSPGVVRAGRVGTVVVEYQNTGVTNVAAPLMMFSATNAKYKLTEQSSFTTRALPMLGINPDGPAGVLPPGSKGSIRVQVTGIADIAGDYRVDVLDGGESMDWSAYKTGMKPPTVDAGAWDAIYGNFQSIVGTTVAQWQMVLGSVAELFRQTGDKTFEVDRLQQYLLRYADQFGAISSRYRLGTWGRGWPDATTNEVSADPAGNLLFNDGGSIRFFEKQADGTYRGMNGDVAAVTRNANVTTLRESSGVLYTYRADGKLITLDDAYGNRLTYAYDSSGRLLTLTDFDGDTRQYTYNSAGRVTKVVDYDGSVATFAYDAANEHLLALTDDQGTTTFTYVTGLGAAREHALATKTDPNGVTTTYEYDATGRKVRESLNGGAMAVTFEHTRMGEYVERDATGNTTVRRFNSRGQIVETVDRTGLRATLSYDATGNAAGIVDAAGSRWTNDFDSRGRVTSIVDPLGQTELFAYAGTSELPTAARNAEGNVLQFVRAATSSPLEIVYPDDSRETFTYDSHGRMTSETSRAGVTIAYQYGPQSQLVRSDVEGGETRTYEYAADRSLTKIVTPDGETTFSYDAFGRTTRVAYPNGRAIDYAYDLAGRNVRIATNDGFEQRFEYDSLSRLSRVRDGNGALIVEYLFDAVGRLSRENRGNGSFTTYGYDAEGRTTRIEFHDGTGAVSQRLDYQYDLAGRISKSISDGNETRYEYDATGQLTKVSLPNGRTIAYEYDPAGNRIRTIDSGIAPSSVVVEYVSNNLDQYTTIGGDVLSYDLNGDLISRAGPNGTTTYEYNGRRQLIRATGPVGTWNYEYDAMGNRSAVVHDGVRTEYLVDPLGLALVIAEYDGAGQVRARYTYGAGLTSRIDGAGAASYYDFDFTGNALQLTDDQGTVTERFTYLPFGERLSGNHTAFGFHGKSGVIDDDNGLVYMRARYYDPAQGRFTQPDPIRLRGGDLNLYRFVANDPINFVDPLGHNKTGLMQADGSYKPTEAKFEYYNKSAQKVIPENPRISFIERARERLRQELEARASMLANANKAKSGLGLRLTDVPDAPTKPPAAVEPRGTRPSPTMRDHTLPLSERFGSFGSRLRGLVRQSAIFTGVEIVADPNVLELALYRNRPDESPFGDAALKHPDVKDARDDAYDDQKQRALLSVACNGLSFVISTPILAASIPAAALTGPFAPVVLIAEAALLSFLIKTLCWKIFYIAPSDPNEMTGPASYGPDHYVAAEAPLGYSVFFENKPSATAPAQEVVVTQQLDADLDWNTFEQGDFHFGDTVVSPPAGSASFDMTVDATASVGSLVRIRGDVNRSTGLVTWIFTSLDPTTGDFPEEPLAGFLPPNAPPPIGEGSIDFWVRRKGTAGSGTRIDAQATIVFDTEAPLSTAPIFHTLDAAAPQSAVASLPAVWTELAPVVSWAGADEAGGSGMRSYDVYVSTDNGPFVVWLDDTTLTSKLLDLPRGHAYSFYSIATDNVGHEETTPATPDATTYYLGPPWHNFQRALDVSGDGDVTPLDALLIINELNSPTTIDGNNRLPLPPPTLAPQRPFWDVDGNNLVTPVDALLVINRLNGGPEPEGEFADEIEDWGESPPTDPRMYDAVWAIEDWYDTHRRRTGFQPV